MEKLRVYQFEREEDKHIVWLVWCSMCKTHHPYDSGRWVFNGDFEKPTFRESMLIKRPARQNIQGKEISAYVCHSYITDGMILYLGDCTHELKGQTIPLEREQWSDDEQN